MSLSFQQTEELLKKLKPTAMRAAFRGVLEADVAAEGGDCFDWHGGHEMIEKILTGSKPLPLHPQQYSIFNQAREDGRLEADLAGLKPLPPSQRWTGETLEKIRQEGLAGLRPKALSDQRIGELARVMTQASQQAASSAQDHDKVTPFKSARARRASSRFVSLGKVAAAVAVAGALFGALIPGRLGNGKNALVTENIAPEQRSEIRDNSSPVLPAFAGPLSPQWAPATVSTEARALRDGGIIETRNSKALRDVQFERVEQVMVVDSEGRLRTFERPLGVQHVRIPVETN